MRQGVPVCVFEMFVRSGWSNRSYRTAKIKPDWCVAKTAEVPNSWREKGKEGEGSVALSKILVHNCLI